MPDYTIRALTKDTQPRLWGLGRFDQSLGPRAMRQPREFARAHFQARRCCSPLCQIPQVRHHAPVFLPIRLGRFHLDFLRPNLEAVVYRRSNFICLF